MKNTIVKVVLFLCVVLAASTFVYADKEGKAGMGIGGKALDTAKKALPKTGPATFTGPLAITGQTTLASTTFSGVATFSSRISIPNGTYAIPPIYLASYPTSGLLASNGGLGVSFEGVYAVDFIDRMVTYGAGIEIRAGGLITTYATAQGGYFLDNSLYSPYYPVYGFSDYARYNEKDPGVGLAWGGIGCSAMVASSSGVSGPVQIWSRATGTTILTDLTIASNTYLASATFSGVATHSADIVMTASAVIKLSPTAVGSMALCFSDSLDTGINYYNDQMRFYNKGVLTFRFYAGQMVLDCPIVGYSYNAGGIHIPHRLATRFVAGYSFLGMENMGVGRNGTASVVLITDDLPRVEVCATGTTIATNLNIASDTTLGGKFSLSVASGGYQIYQGDGILSTLKTFSLPLNAASVQIDLASGTVNFVNAEIVMRMEASASAVVFRLRSEINANNNAPFEMGASDTRRMPINDADDCSAIIVPGTPGFTIIASGTIGSVWQVKKLEVGGL